MKAPKKTLLLFFALLVFLGSAVYLVKRLEKIFIDGLVRDLQSTNPEARAKASRRLIRGRGVSVPRLIKALEDLNKKDVQNFSDIANILAQLGPEARAAVPILTKKLENSNSQVRTYAYYALGSIDSRRTDAIPALIKVIEDEKGWVRLNAAVALYRIDPETKLAIPALVKALGEDDKRVRKDAASALGEIGADAKDAIPALRKALEDHNKGVRNRAAKALKKILPE